MKKILIYILFTICSVCNIHAEFSLVHKTGMYDELQENGMQAVHTETKIVYANPGDTVYLYRPERSTFTSYVRWYCYDTDRAIPETYNADESPYSVAGERIIRTWDSDSFKKIYLDDLQ